MALKGVVVNVGDFGVFADIGYEQNAILAIPRRLGHVKQHDPGRWLIRMPTCSLQMLELQLGNADSGVDFDAATCWRLRS